MLPVIAGRMDDRMLCGVPFHGVLYGVVRRPTLHDRVKSLNQESPK